MYRQLYHSDKNQCTLKFVKRVLRGKFIVIQAFFKKKEKAQINNLTHHLEELEKEEQTIHYLITKRSVMKSKRKSNNT